MTKYLTAKRVSSRVCDVGGMLYLFYVLSLLHTVGYAVLEIDNDTLSHNRVAKSAKVVKIVFHMVPTLRLRELQDIDETLLR